MRNYATGQEWGNRHNHEDRLHAACAKCGCRKPKRQMFTIYTIRPRCGTPKMLTHVCADCMTDVLDMLGVSIDDVTEKCNI